MLNGELVYTGKAKDRELVVLLFDRWEMLRKLGDATPWCAVMWDEKWPDAKELESAPKCWWMWPVDSSSVLIGAFPVSGPCWWVSGLCGSSSQEFFLLSNSASRSSEIVDRVWLLSSPCFSTFCGTIEFAKTALWTCTYKYSKRDQNHIVFVERSWLRSLNLYSGEDEACREVVDLALTTNRLVWPLDVKNGAKQMIVSAHQLYGWLVVSNRCINFTNFFFSCNFLSGVPPRGDGKFSKPVKWKISERKRCSKSQI